MTQYGDNDEIKQRAGIDPSDLGLTQAELDNLVTQSNRQGSEAVEGYCQRDFEHHVDETFNLDGNDRARLRLPGWPIITITSVKIDGTLIDSDEYRIRPMPGNRDLNSGVLEKKTGVWRRPLRGWENIEVVATWGFQEPPEVVQDVVNDLAVRDLQGYLRNIQLRGATQISLEGFSIGFGTAEERQLELTDGHKDKLDPYRQVVAA